MLVSDAMVSTQSEKSAYLVILTARPVNLFSTQDQPDINTLSTVEKEALGRAAVWRDTGISYAQEHRTRPSTIGNVLSSSPLALLAW